MGKVILCPESVPGHQCSYKFQSFTQVSRKSARNVSRFRFHPIGLIKRFGYAGLGGAVLCSAEHKKPRDGSMDDDFWNQSDLTPEQEKLAGGHLGAVVLAIVIVFVIVAGIVVGRTFGWW